MVGGGDQIYCDSLTREPELQPWINAPDRKAKINFPLTEELVSTPEIVRTLTYSNSRWIASSLSTLGTLLMLASLTTAMCSGVTLLDVQTLRSQCRFGQRPADTRVNMLDDHDLIDGFGTYDDETQRAPVFSYIGSRGYFWYLLFQVFVVGQWARSIGM